MGRRTIGIMGRQLDQEDGLGVYALYLLREMFKLDPTSDYVVFLGTPKSAHKFDEFPNVRTCVVPARFKLYWDQVVVPRLARKFDVDLIFHAKFSIPLFTRRPCVFVQQGSDWFVNPGNYPWWDNLYIRLMLPIYSWKATRTLAISRATLDDLARHTCIDVKNSVVTYAGVGPNFTPHRDEAALAQFKAEYGLPERFILTVARTLHVAHRGMPVYPGGNNERLVRAYLRYRRTGGDLPLVVVGMRIEEYLRSRGFTDADLEGIVFTGFIPNTRIHMAYQLAQCFVLASLCESFGIPIVEAFACGCPAIVPSTCASPEIAGGAARLVNPHDEQSIAEALLEVTSSETLRAELRELGLRRAQTLSWRDTAARTLAVFDEIVPGRLATAAEVVS